MCLLVRMLEAVERCWRGSSVLRGQSQSCLREALKADWRFLSRAVGVETEKGAVGAFPVSEGSVRELDESTARHWLHGFLVGEPSNDVAAHHGVFF